MWISRYLSALALVAAVTFAAPVLQAEELVVGDLHITNVWARPSNTSTGAVYLTISNQGKSADTLIGITSSVAENTEMHEMTMTDMVMRMRKAASVSLPAGQSVSFAPGGMHIMLIGLKRPLKEGESFNLSLELKNAGHVELPVTVSSNAMSTMGKMNDMMHSGM